jgi:peptidyl-prolyl cis-trans isomerase D
MLQTIREKTSGWIATVIIGLLIIPFAFFGVNNYFSEQAELWVAKVGEEEISQETYRRRFDEYRQQMRQMLGENFDPTQLETPEAKRRVLDALVEEALLRQAAAGLGMAVSANQLQQAILDIEAFKVDGKFDVNQYRVLLASQGMTPVSFEQRMREDLEVRALPTALSRSALVTANDLDDYFRLRDQKRDFRHLELPVPDDAAVGEPSEEQLATFHKDNQQRYQTEETVSIEYVEVDAKAVPVPAVPDEDTLRQRYEEQKNRFTEIEQRLASHILIKVPADADAAAQSAAQARAQALVEQARAAGADFAALAREHSEDVGSKAAGGDLGWIETGLTDPAFESALFAMQAGSISEPVKSAEGWHVIQLREVRPGDIKPFEAVREELLAEYLETERERAHSELAGRLVDITFKDPSTLATAAKELDLEIKQAGPFGRFGGAEGIVANPAVLAAAFEPAAIRERTASNPIDLGDGRTAVIRVVEHTASAPLPLDKVRDQVAADWKRDTRRRLADERANALFARLEAGESLDALATELGLAVGTAAGVGRSEASVDRTLVTEAFTLPRPQGETPQRALVSLGGDRKALLEVTRVSDGDPAAVPAAERTATRQQIEQAHAAAEIRELVELLKQTYPVRLAEQRL